MFTPWIKRKSLKRDTKSKRLVVDGVPPSMIALLVVSAIFVGVGLFVIQQSLAEDRRVYPLRPTPSPFPTPATSTPTPQSPSPSHSPTPRPTVGAPGAMNAR